MGKITDPLGVHRTKMRTTPQERAWCPKCGQRGILIPLPKEDETDPDEYVEAYCNNNGCRVAVFRLVD